MRRAMSVTVVQNASGSNATAGSGTQARATAMNRGLASIRHRQSAPARGASPRRPTHHHKASITVKVVDDDEKQSARFGSRARRQAGGPVEESLSLHRRGGGMTFPSAARQA